LKRILLVDRELKTVEQLRDPLERRAFDVEIALSGEIGLQILEERHVDAILLSVGEGEGDDPAVFLRQVGESHSDIPVVLVTESIDASKLELLAGPALRACHRKPLSLDGLLADIEDVCR
jgi:DNA-binding response OmpR family regulator